MFLLTVSTASMSNPAIRKDQERKTAAKNRKVLHAALPNAGRDLAEHVRAGLPSLGLDASGKTVSVFWSMGSEIDTLPLLQALNDAGIATALPVVVKKASPLVFRAWAPEDQLVDGGFGTSVPEPMAPEVRPDVLIVPLLAYDNDGYRLGYGGGFYDRTLEMLRRDHPGVIAVGVAFSGQRVDTVTRGPHDQPLDWIATEAGLKRIGRDEIDAHRAR